MLDPGQPLEYETGLLIDRKVAKEKHTDGQSNLLFSNQAHAMDDALIDTVSEFMAQFFPDCVIRVRSFCSTISKFFHIYYS